MKKFQRQSTRLDSSSRRLLEDIRQIIESTGMGVDATTYRAQRGKQLDVLDRLEHLGFLRKEQDKYWVNLHGLFLLNDDKSNSLLNACESVFIALQRHYESNPKTKVMIADLAKTLNMSYGQTAMCLGYMCEFHFWGGYTNSLENPAESYVIPAEAILRHNTFKDIVVESILLKQKNEASSRKYKFSPSPPGAISWTDLAHEVTLPNSFDADSAWAAIGKDYDTNKKLFAKRIAFVSDSFKREIILRDIAQAYLLVEQGFSKPALILAGGVLEELLRLFLEFKGLKPTNETFDAYIKKCTECGLLKPPVHKLIDSFRQFRNLVHLNGESEPRHTISKATARGAVSSIFTISNDFH